MNLYEITNGWTGESYCRAYAWAESEEEARELYSTLAPDKSRGIRNVRLLFSSSDGPFVTPPTDDGENWTKLTR